MPPDPPVASAAELDLVGALLWDAGLIEPRVPAAVTAWLTAEYVDPPAGKGRSRAEIGAQLGCHRDTVGKALLRYGVPIRAELVPAGTPAERRAATLAAAAERGRAERVAAGRGAAARHATLLAKRRLEAEAAAVVLSAVPPPSLTPYYRAALQVRVDHPEATYEELAVILAEREGRRRVSRGAYSTLFAKALSAAGRVPA